MEPRTPLIFVDQDDANHSHGISADLLTAVELYAESVDRVMVSRVIGIVDAQIERALVDHAVNELDESHPAGSFVHLRRLRLALCDF